MKRFAPILLVALLPGCVSMSKLAEQLKQDPATVKVKVTTVYGVFEFERSFPTNCVQTIQVTMPVTVSTNR